MADAQTNPNRWKSLAAICSAAAIVWFSFSDMSIALPTISQEMSESLTTLQWVTIAFGLTTGALVIVTGRFSDLFGRRSMLQLGVLVLVATSLLSSLAPNVGWLIAGRALMGIGAAMILPATLALIPAQFSAEEQPKAFSVWQAVAWSGQIIGPAFGGLLTQTIGWRWISAINIPLGLITWYAIKKTTEESIDETASRKIDYLGVGLSGSAVFVLLFGCSLGQTKGFTDPVVLGLAAAALILAFAFVFTEKHVKSPIISMDMFKNRALDAGLISNTSMNLIVGGFSFVLTIYLQNARGEDPLTAGIVLLPAVVMLMVFLPLGAKLSKSQRGMRNAFSKGLFLLALSGITLSFFLEDWNWIIASLILFVFGAGLGVLSTPVSNAAVGTVGPRLAGMASGSFKMTSMVGSSLGVALSVTFLQAFETRTVVDQANAAGMSQDQIATLKTAMVDSDLANQVLSSVPPQTRDQMIAVAQDALTEGTMHSVRLVSFTALLAIVAVWIVWPKKMTASKPATQKRRERRESWRTKSFRSQPGST